MWSVTSLAYTQLNAFDLLVSLPIKLHNTILNAKIELKKRQQFINDTLFDLPETEEKKFEIFKSLRQQLQIDGIKRK